ncbi:type IV pilus assembly protein PilQ [Desulfuromusa kysingii]|uniref:Type IV pilus assembly protein PilQ n=1 Tax=Desulfuromusa kysingii TaxID=37625 RepID=A0A1H4CYV2_9BACT|nr:type IV pilus secretin family protein [Desulfuromusa kysingii]SEA65262.1 type IV pilus assembly protein PilQ [Desulfuromusa kysingii]
MRRSVVLLSMLLMFLSVALVSPLCAADSFSKVSVAEKKVQLTATAGIEQIRYFTLDSPKRLVVDLYGVLPGQHDENLELNNGFKLLRVGLLDNKTRFVFDVTGAVFPTYNVMTDSNQVTVTWEHSQAAVADALAEPATVGSAKITAIDFASEEGQSRVYIHLQGTSDVSDLVQDGNKIVFAFKKTTLPRSLRRVFDTLAFPSAIHSVTPYLVDESGQPETRFVVFLKGDVPYRLDKSASGYTFSVDDQRYAQAAMVVTGTLPVSAAGNVVTSQQQSAVLPAMTDVSSGPSPAPLAVPVIEQVGSQGKRYSGEKTSLVFDNAEVRDILRLIAEISDLNIIASDEVKGNVTLRLIDVPWDQSLELILDVTGLGMVQEGNVVRVLPIEKIRSMREAELTAVRSQEKLEPVVTEVVTVSYADLKSVSGPVRELLSDRGTITDDSRNKLLIITDVPQRIKKAKELIKILDTPERQVMIEARIVEVNSEYSRSLGVNWGFSSDFEDSNLNSMALSAGGDFIVGTTLASVGGVGAGFTFGDFGLDSTVLDLRLSALEGASKAKVISTPRVTTLNGQEATISQGTEVPYQTVEDGEVNIEFKEVVLELAVTPVINPDGSVILTIDAKNDSLVPDGEGALYKKTANTKVLVQDGETTVLGGIFIESIGDADSGVPFLKNIPVLGSIFKSTSKTSTKNELLIFVTPRIMQNN